MAEQHTELEFLDLLAWMHCPMAASAGYVPDHPRGSAATANRILDTWPDATDALKLIVPSIGQATDWMIRTRFNMIRLSHGTAVPPPALDTGYWLTEGRPKSWTGILVLSPTLSLRFTIPYLHKLDGRHFEIVILDTNPLPPEPSRRHNLLMEAAFLADAFRTLTGHHAFVRLLAPAYAHEETLTLPPQPIERITRLISTIRPLPFIRPGDWCSSTTYVPGRSTMTRRWRCPVREAGACKPF